MTRLLPATAAVALVSLAAPLHAEDPRLVSRLYDETQVVRVDGRANVQTTIRFGDDELIENVAIGDSQAWQVTPNKRANLLFVKPLADRAVTNMTVITNEHTYLFDLMANPKNESPLYVLSFTYPTPINPTPKGVAPVDGPNEVELAAASDAQAIVDPAELNFAWDKTGDRNLMPARIYDDGTATFLAWPAGEPVPAILMKDKAGTEGPVNYAVRGDVIVIEGVPKKLILRSGKDMATLQNNGPARPIQALARLDEVKQ
ncbi:type VI secretion protein [Altererythrobacter salegens]|uniref:Type VI secretion protein n=1 Tax=Croceibacterium salegens TaxID=1737568 RepID=A0A6I4SSL1_9SPHN|nr:TrbG/VirB9 family P-type conjugative transfer protein [Croceibacterium salegens]MXO57956.1 type VI secretion protein [Croceibacterium salegens]